MVVNLFDLKRVLLQVLEEFDHKHLNLDLPYFERQIPTSENIARVLWDKLQTQQDVGILQRICLYEDEDLCAELTAEAGLEVASVTRRYSFTAVHDGHRGHTWDLFVTVHGRIELETGMVTDIVALDQLVKIACCPHSMGRICVSCWPPPLSPVNAWRRPYGSVSYRPSQPARYSSSSWSKLATSLTNTLAEPPPAHLLVYAPFESPCGYRTFPPGLTAYMALQPPTHRRFIFEIS